jgi:hypothetical protein
MPPKHKPDDGSKPAVSRTTRSHSRVDVAENASIDMHEVLVGPATNAKAKEKRDVRGKRKVDDAKFDDLDAPETRNETSSKKTVKRTKKKQPEPPTYINPFIPEPSLSVAGHEAHSRALSKARYIMSPNDPPTDGQSLFSKSLASASDQDTSSTPFQTLSSIPKPRSQTPARPLLVLAPLPPKGKNIPNRS